LNFLRQFGPASAFLRGVAGYDFYAHDTVLNREYIDMQAGTDLRFGQCDATLTGDYARRQSDLEDVTTTVTQNTLEVPAASLGFRCTRPIGFSPFVTVSQTWNNNSASLLRTSDYNTFLTSGGVAYKHPFIGELDLFGQYSVARFPNRLFPDGTGLVADSYNHVAGGLRITRDFGSKLSLTASVSYTSVDPRIATEQSFSGLTYLVDLTYRISPRLQFEGGFNRDAAPSNQFNTTFSVGDSYHATLGYEVNEKLNIGLHGERRDQKFSGALLEPGVNIGSETVDSAGGFVRYSLTNKLTLNLNLDYQNRDADVRIFSYSDYRAGIAVTAAF